jgi:dTDP-4-amino-4,6-dideoxygalactose transaminase
VIRAENRDQLSDYLKKNDIQNALHYPKILPNLPAYDYLNINEDFPVANAYESQILSLPMYPELTEESIQYVARIISEFYDKE